MLQHPLRSVLEYYIKRRAVYLESAFCSSGVADETHFAESIHEEAGPRADGADYVCHSFLPFWELLSREHPLCRSARA